MSEISELEGNDLLLALLRRRIGVWEKAERGTRQEFEAAESFTRAFAELDLSLHTGGELPQEWREARKPDLPDETGSYLQETFGTHEVRLPKPPGEGVSAS